MEDNGVLIACAVASHQTNDVTHSNLGYQLRCFNGIVVHVVEARGSAANHLRTSHLHTLRMTTVSDYHIDDERDGDELLLHGPDVVF